MSSPAQAAANAANAKLSTGPVTARGKAASSRNATRHGLSAKQPLIHPNQQKEFDELSQTLHAEIVPIGALETGVFHLLLHAAWKQRIVHRMEQDLLDRGLEALEDEKTAQSLDRLNRYAASADRAWYRALKELRTLQTARTLRQTIEPDVAELIPNLADIPSIAKLQSANHKADDAALDDYLNAEVPPEVLAECRAQYAKQQQVA